MSYYDDRVDKIARDLGGDVAGRYPLDVPDYSFYDYSVIKTPQGLYVSTDSGCSCPTPFESHSVEDFTGPLTPQQAAEEYLSLATVDGMYNPLPEDDARAFAAEIAAL